MCECRYPIADLREIVFQAGFKIKEIPHEEQEKIREIKKNALSKIENKIKMISQPFICSENCEESQKTRKISTLILRPTFDLDLTYLTIGKILGFPIK